MAFESIPARLQRRGREHGDAPALHVHDGGVWRATSWAAYAAEVHTAARALVALGFGSGDRLCILGNNRPEWVILDLAAMTAGGVPAGIYTTCSPTEVRYVVDHAEARIVLVEDEAQWEKIERERHHLPLLQHVVLMRGTRVDDPLALGWDDFLALGREALAAEVEARLAALAPEDPATFIYTSGTTGPPKAVVLTHDNLVHTAGIASELFALRPGDRVLSYLPLAHVAEQMFTIHGPVSHGIEVFFSRGLEALLEDLQATRPTLFFGVPRVWEKMHARLADALSKATGVKGFLAGWALQVGRRAADLRNRGETPRGFLGLQARLAHEKVHTPILKRLGLDACRVAVSGAAPIGTDVLRFFAGLGLVIHEVYGQSEDCGPTTFNRPGATRFGTVGRAVPGVELRVADDGEVLVRGRNVFAGYFKDPEATAEALAHGWLHSGDVGVVDADGFLTITGRKKEILITAGGKNVAPANLEAALKRLPLVSQAVVIGDRRPYLVALLTLDPEATGAFAASRGLPAEDLHDHADLLAEIQRGVDGEVNPDLARVEQIKRFAVLPRELSQEEGELTPTLKIRRRVVEQRFSDVVEALYEDGTRATA